jgi:hypothetical protein
MHRIRRLFTHILVAASIFGVAGAAGAVPTYEVSINTAPLGTGHAYLGMYLMGLAGATQATATVTNLAGSFIGPAMLDGSATGTLPGPIVFGSANGGGDLVQAIQLGGTFKFDVDFTIAAGNIGSTFGWALFDDVQYLGVNGDLGDINLVPDAPLASRIQLVSSGSPLSHVVKIDEPPVMALVLLSLALMAFWHLKARRGS